MKYKAAIKLKQPKAVVQIKKHLQRTRLKKVRSVFKVAKEIITKLKILEEIKGSYFSDNPIKTLKGEYFS